MYERKDIEMMEIQKTIESLEKNGFDVFYVKNRHEIRKVFFAEIYDKTKPKTISYGDSITVELTGIIDELRHNEEINMIDTIGHDLSWREQIQARKEVLQVDLFITGTNSVTTSGHLINLDMIGNRVAGIAFGPKKVVIIVGKNKISNSLEAGMIRVKKIAPQNAARHKELEVPCQHTKRCIDCNNVNRICNTWMITERSYPRGRIKIIIVDEELGL